ncbi:hypothetical protein [Tardiphaga robiniae]|uniref:Uncharacterized protein n=1 Tax=Tardiphaga robiniae TaxID=943830 RepID=A0A7G6U2B0_9BRAD|nr:hypothetical protein [Tardiphaga robiniae]QND73142.1 hypothetical protein HB776_19470 [Tardiphaga robiniae]
MNTAQHAFDLAEILETAEETTLGPTDSELVATALRHYAEWLDSNTP